MKKTFTLLLAAVAAFSMTAANFLTVDEAQVGTPVKMENVKKAPAGMQEIMMEKFAAKIKATPNFPVTNAPDDLVGGYDWAYRQYTGGLTTQPDTLSADQYDQEDNIDLVGMNKISDTQIRLTGFMPMPVTATMGTTGNYTTFTVDEGQTVYTHSSYGACTVKGVWYYEGDDTYDAGWYYGDIMGYILDQGILMDPDVNFYLVIQSGTYANYRLGWIYAPGSVMIPDEDFNGMMSFNYNSATWDWPVIVSEDNSTYVVSVDNFAGIGTAPATFNLEEGNTWTADPTVFYVSGSNNFALYGYDGETDNLIDLIGTGTEKVLTFGSDWTGCDNETGYWIGERSNTTITLISDDEFVYPTPPEPVITINPGFGTFEEAQTVYVTVENMPEGGAIKYELIPSNAKAWEDYDATTGIAVDESAALTVAVFDATGNKLAEVSGEFTITPSTGIETVETSNVDNAWYNIAGVKFNGKPSVPGIYINNGKKVVIK